MEEKNTELLQSELLRADKLEKFMEENKKILKVQSVPDYLHELLIKYGIEKKEVIQKAELNGTYGYQIFDGRKSAGRDKLIQLAFGFGLTVEETQKLLRLGGYNELYVKKKREAFVMYALQKGYNVNQLNELLYQNEEEIFE